ncbi:FHA domain-containing protein [Streptomyces griseorubiginosus]|uniref:FHA domain-containing protein n=1 Tax=Streptomyces griseorubiginosus TaxID=67304 RepID=UPI0036C0DA88
MSASEQKGPLTAMQIRLTVVDPLGPPDRARGRAASCDVLVTAPVGTALAAVAGALASAVPGEAGASRAGEAERSGGTVVLYADGERLDAQRATLGEPPLIDGAVLSLGAPAAPEPHPELDEAPTQLHVVAGPDAGGVHLLHGGQIHIGRSADADVPLDDPDVSRLHCAITVAADGHVSVADLGSTNGTILDGARVGARPVRFLPGALLRIGESVLRLSPSGGGRLETEPDGEGHVRVAPGESASGDGGSGRGAAGPAEGADGSGAGRGADRSRGGGRDFGTPRGAAPAAGHLPGQGRGAPDSAAEVGEAAATTGYGAGPGRGAPGSTAGAGEAAYRSGAGRGRRVSGRAGGNGAGASGAGAGASVSGGGVEGSAHARGGRDSGGATAQPPTDRTHHTYGSADWGASGGDPGVAPAQGHGPVEPPVVVPGQGGAPRIENRGGGRAGGSLGAASSGDVGERPGVSGAVPGARAHGSAGAASGDTGERRLRGPESAGGGGVGSSSGYVGSGNSAGSAGSVGSVGDTHGGRAGIGSFTESAAAASGPSVPSVQPPTAQDTPSTLDPAEPGTGRRKGTPLRGTDAPQSGRRRGGLGKWARRLAGGRGEPETAERDEPYAEEPAPVATAPSATAAQVPEVWPDPAALLLTALGPGARLWERGPGHPEALTVRLGTADRAAPDGSGLLPAVPVTADLREAGALGLAGPRARLAGLARAVVAQLAALHAPETLEIVLISADRSRPAQERTAEWSWLGWLPHVRPGHGQDCRLLLAHDREQAAARTDELLRRLDDHLADAELAPPRGMIPAARSTAPDGLRGAARRPSWARDDAEGGDTGGFPGPYTVVVVDGDPGGADLRKAVARLAAQGPRAGIHVVCLAETAPASPASPVTDTYEAACAAAPTFRECGAVGLLSGDVATALRLMRVARAGMPTGAGRPTAPSGSGSAPTAPGADSETYGTAPGAETTRPDTTRPAPRHPGADTTRTVPRPTVASAGHGTATRPDPDTLHLTPAPTPVGHGTVAAVDAVSAAWAERFARALAPLRTDGAAGAGHARVSSPLPQSARLLDELGLARATPPSLMTRWADAADDPESLGGRAWAVLGAGPRGPVCADLVAEGPHLLIEGPAGSGRTELLRAVVASLAAAERPDRLSVVLMDGRDSVGAGGGHGEGLRVCTDVPHVTTHLTANDPVRMREFAQSLSAELKRRAELLGRSDFAEWHTGRELSGRMVAQRTATTRGPAAAKGTSTTGVQSTAGPHGTAGTNGIPAAAAADPAAADLDSPPSATIRLRPGAARRQAEAVPPLPRLVVVVDDLDALVSPPLGSPGRPAAGSVIRALEAVAREGERLGVHLVAASGPGGRTAESEPARRATLRVTLDAPATGPEEPAPGRGRLTWSDGRVTAFQAGRVTGRIPRTATLRPTVVPLEWERMGDPPTRRPVRELGNGPTDLALLASALERAAREVAAAEVPSLL